MDLVFLRFGYNSGETVKGQSLGGITGPITRAGIVFLRGAMSNDALNGISIPYSHNESISTVSGSEAMG